MILASFSVRSSHCFGFCFIFLRFDESEEEENRQKRRSHNLLSINSTVDTLFIKFEINNQVFAVYSSRACSLHPLFSVIEKKTIQFIIRSTLSLHRLLSLVLAIALSTNPQERILFVNWSTKMMEHLSWMCVGGGRFIIHPQPLIPDSLCFVGAAAFDVFIVRQSVHFLIISSFALLAHHPFVSPPASPLKTRFLYPAGKVCFSRATQMMEQFS